MMSNAMMFISMFIIQYLFMSFIMTNRIENITNSLGKIYISIMMGLSMIIVMNFMSGSDATQTMTYIVLLFAFIFLYKIQFGINDTNYLREMIEHHSMALLTSEEILQKTQSERVKKLAENIISTQEKEIEYMKQLIEYEK